MLALGPTRGHARSALRCSADWHMHRRLAAPRRVSLHAPAEHAHCRMGHTARATQRDGSHRRCAAAPGSRRPCSRRSARRRADARARGAAAARSAAPGRAASRARQTRPGPRPSARLRAPRAPPGPSCHRASRRRRAGAPGSPPGIIAKNTRRRPLSSHTALQGAARISVLSGTRAHSASTPHMHSCPTAAAAPPLRRHAPQFAHVALWHARAAGSACMPSHRAPRGAARPLLCTATGSARTLCGTRGRRGRQAVTRRHNSSRAAGRAHQGRRRRRAA